MLMNIFEGSLGEHEGFIQAERKQLDYIAKGGLLSLWYGSINR